MSTFLEFEFFCFEIPTASGSKIVRLAFLKFVVQMMNTNVLRL